MTPSIIVSSHQPNAIAQGLKILSNKNNRFCDPDYVTQLQRKIDNMPESFHRMLGALTEQIFNSWSHRGFDRLNIQHTEITKALARFETVDNRSSPHQATVAVLRAAQALTHEALIRSTEFQVTTSNFGDADLVMPPRSHSDIEWAKQLAERKNLDELIAAAPRLLGSLLTESRENAHSIFVIMSAARSNDTNLSTEPVQAVMRFYAEFSSMVGQKLYNEEMLKNIAPIFRELVPLLRRIQNQEEGLAISEMSPIEREKLFQFLVQADMVIFSSDTGKCQLTYLGEQCITCHAIEEQVARDLKSGTTKVVVGSAVTQPEESAL
jgi:hypothetical protein